MMFNLDKPLKFLWILLLYISMVYAECEPHQHVREANRIIALLVNQVEKNFDVSCTASGGSMVHDIKEITMTFRHYGTVSIEEVRSLEINITQFCLQIINNDKKIRSFLNQFPATHENLHIALSFYDQNGRKFHDDSVALVNQQRSRLIYKKNDPTSPRFITIMEEPYEEAERLVQETKEKQIKGEGSIQKPTEGTATRS